MAEVVVTATFKRRYKPLAKRHRSLEQDVLGLISSLEELSMQGTPLGKDCYKIRLAVSSKGGGKSGGARVITYVRLVKGKVYLLTIYDKSDQSSLSAKELHALVDSIG
ncbi:MAG: type II toxin-antitoxin system RelE/ParE family toxin [Bacteroidetes bacterium]|nr:type II toxin-antitoxin system RelE/ParE family toxin [Bacteroidota bacterium]MBS1942257.1 type II toxin-antitoxin system RelE/ParE family toxin [Bacteroidota bacterium]